ncbi:DUF4328 domain-containing protein [Amycolatopsis suaedae]|uniref:DUF4328 domain-containing protein n=1 Tax=Amycolatopsis suaedae TaxID=2510978 RepID=A0A4Q7JB25_9PSEU|nr:DUF4328 domain-containing protein [Amycolatopsis suaedae]RZQ63434.1 DUF4328 domain-containing protein [Amycolatopsis suaedae]
MTEAIERADSSVAVWEACFVLLNLATGIVFIIWQHRHATNAVALRGPLGLGPGWAIGGCSFPSPTWCCR